MDADLVRRLTREREGTALDFKERAYPNDARGNRELAKDVMAMANALEPGSDPAYILLGVRETSHGTGEVVGIPEDQHLDDAAYQQKVRSALNAAPRFRYGRVTVDGASVGVFEVRPGGRPYYPITDAAPLTRDLPMVRQGSSTAPAPPDRVTRWRQADDASARLALSLLLTPAGGGLASSPGERTYRVLLENCGDGSAIVEEAIVRWQPRAEWRARGFTAEIEKSVMPGGGRAVEPHASRTLNAALREQDFPAEARGQADPGGYEAVFRVRCRNTLGQVAEVSLRVSQDGGGAPGGVGAS